MYLDMVLVVSLDNMIGVEVIIRCQVLALQLSCPLNILLPPSQILIAVNQTQYHMNPTLVGLGNYKV